MATGVTLAVFDSIGSICIKTVASKIMHSVFSIMLLCLQICFWFNGWNLVIDSCHNFWKYFKTPCAFSKDKIPSWKSKLLTNTDASPNHSWLHCCIFGMSASVLLLTLLLGFIEHLLRFILSIKLYKSFLHELFPHFLCLRHQASLDDITHVAKSVRSVRRGLCGVKGRSMNQLSNI